MELLSVKQAATILGIDDSRVRQLLRAGVLEGQQVGGDGWSTVTVLGSGMSAAVQGVVRFLRATRGVCWPH